MPYQFWIIGGDLRVHWLARQLADDGNTVHTFGLDATFLPPSPFLHIESSLSHCYQGDCVVFPLPMTKTEGLLSAPYHSPPLSLDTIFSYLNPSQFIVGGNISSHTRQLATQHQLDIHDYFTREELTLANAVPTAEGCVQIAMERLPTTIQGGQFLITGYGYVAKATAKRVSALGGNVTIVARRFTALAEANAEGYQTLPLCQFPHNLQRFHHYDAVINTVPAPILAKPQLEALSPSCLLLDLASTPGGFDLDAVATLQRTVVPALSLPGKVAPATAGLAIKGTLYQMLEEQRNL